MTKTPLVSVVIVTLNEESNLPACLASLAGLDCEVLVVDSGSRDQTVSIAAAGGARVFHHPFENYSAQRNWSMDNLPLAGDWLLQLDADERLTPDLVREIMTVLPDAPAGTDGYLIPRRTVFLGRWIRHGGHYPVFQLRLFRKGKGRCEDRLYDQHFVTRGPVGTLANDYIDVVASTLSAWTKRHTRWAELEADQSCRAPSSSEVPERFFGGPIQRRRWLRNCFYGKWPLFIRPFAYWFYRYFLRLGFLDGREGLIFHFLQGFWFRFLVDTLIYQRRGAALSTAKAVTRP